ncbi:hypothetical protein, partial [Burkholderia vietnamiensis]|uniref:hypothetical protein n=1 Tax=Burkholderia vietnamiensis TaxID=60552 RepID=UPI001ADCF1B2
MIIVAPNRRGGFESIGDARIERAHQCADACREPGIAAAVRPHIDACERVRERAVRMKIPLRRRRHAVVGDARGV